MKSGDISHKDIPTKSGVYLFRGSRNKVLYVGRATHLRDRVRSYFSSRLIRDRGVRLQEAVDKTRKIETIPTENILDSYILEANLIKKYDPPYNVASKDNKSFPYVVLTREEFPKVSIVRGRELDRQNRNKLYIKIYGPFPNGGVLRDALRILRKILPYRDTCVPYEEKKRKIRRKCLRAELGLCPGVCSGSITKKEYRKRVRDIALFFEGKKKQLITSLEREMKHYAQRQEFEKAQDVKRRSFALTHIQDAHLIRREFAEGGGRGFKIEAFDIAHISGKHSIGVMTVMVDKEDVPQDYRSFILRDTKEGDDLGGLKEILTRRLRHTEWAYANLIVVDGGKTHLQTAKQVLESFGVMIPIVAVVKNERHRAREVLGAKEYIHTYEKEIIKSNAQAHKFALSRHRKIRKRSMFS